VYLFNSTAGRHLWQLKIVISIYGCLISAITFLLISILGANLEEDGRADHDEPVVQHRQARSGTSHLRHDRQGGHPASDFTRQRGKNRRPCFHRQSKVVRQILIFLQGGRKPTHLTSVFSLRTSVLTSAKAASVLPSGDKTDVHRC